MEREPLADEHHLVVEIGRRMALIKLREEGIISQSDFDSALRDGQYDVPDTDFEGQNKFKRRDIR